MQLHEEHEVTACCKLQNILFLYCHAMLPLLLYDLWTRSVPGRGKAPMSWASIPSFPA